MKLLILTQKVDIKDPILGFFHQWIQEFSKHFDEVSVICLEEGMHSLPPNVRVYSLGKERGTSRIGYVCKFYKLIWNLKNEYNTVFVHMNPEYVVLGGWFWRKWSKRIILWYTHREVDIKLRIAEKFVDRIFTASKESFRLPTEKVKVIGHGIDPEKFLHQFSDFSKGFDLIHLGRVTRIKHIKETIIPAAHLLIQEGAPLRYIRIVGIPVTEEDREYKKEIKKYAKELGIEEKLIWDESGNDALTFTPASISINAAPDGGMDKAVLGSLAAGHPTFATNRTFQSVFGNGANVFLYSNAAELAQNINLFLSLSPHEQLSQVEEISHRVRKEFTITSLINKIIADIEHFQMVRTFKQDDHKNDLRLAYPLNEKSVVFDVGGYKGEWATEIWKRYHPRIFIFEPLKEFYDGIQKTFAMNDKVQVFEYGLSDKNEEMMMNINGPASSVFFASQGENISLRDIQEVVKELKVSHIDLLKLNIEGGEFKILPRIIESGLISSCQDIQVQFHDFYPNAIEERQHIRAELQKTHHLTYDYPFVFENWRKNSV